MWDYYFEELVERCCFFVTVLLLLQSAFELEPELGCKERCYLPLRTGLDQSELRMERCDSAWQKVDFGSLQWMDRVQAWIEILDYSDFHPAELVAVGDFHDLELKAVEHRQGSLAPSWSAEEVIKTVQLLTRDIMAD